ncbi:MAG: helix-turn-helix domain-containing protein [Cytophagaceae bacterium]|nr:helix-turn-helix domain-containing protein [Cytophagaceae bacterium]
MAYPFQLQIDFLKQIKDSLPAHASFADELAEVLNVSMDSAYRRIRGETALTIEEAKLLSLKYNISIDQFFRQTSNTVTFQYNSINPSSYSFEDYYKNILASITQIDAGAEKEIVYAAKDIPVFNFFQFPELAAFKIFFWMKTVMNFPGMENSSFSSDKIDEKVLRLGKKILDIYMRIPTVELWNEETLVSTLKQIEYSYESGLIKSKDVVKLLYDKTEALIMHIQKQADHGQKFIYGKEPVQKDGNYKLFINEILLSDNTIFVKKDKTYYTYIPHNAINFLVTSNAAFCEETHSWLTNLQKRSTLISGVSEKDRNRFFRALSEKIQILSREFFNIFYQV